ncbi:MAG: 16S rRNA (uracil(1498)-N(3))-methyltransferase [bacterium]|nr:16S rRNA (uracil(1498)-N(3))-methyltransferase [bacterium]
MRWFYLHCESAAATPPVVGDEVVLDAEESHHLLAVLRRRTDDPVHLLDGRGHRLTGRLAGGDGRAARVEITHVAFDETELATPRLRLVCGVVKGRRWEWALEKAVELGVHAIVPLLAEHGVVEPGRGRRDRWPGVLRAALKQSGRAWLPELGEPVGLDQALETVGDGPCFFGAVPGEVDAVPPLAAIATAPWWTVFIGPEGGWTAAERGALAKAGALPLALGPHVLRTETAAAAALALLQSRRTP